MADRRSTRVHSSIKPKLDWQNIAIKLSTFSELLLPSFCTSNQKVAMPTALAEYDNDHCTLFTQPGLVNKENCQGPNPKSTAYDDSVRRTELRALFSLVQQALYREDIAVEHYVMSNVMKGDAKMFKRNAHIVNEYKRKDSIERMSGKRDSPLPKLVKRLILATNERTNGYDDEEDNGNDEVFENITITCVIVCCKSKPGQNETFEVCIKESCTGARLMDRCLTHLKSSGLSSAKLTFGENGAKQVHRDHRLIDQDIGNGDRIFVNVDAHCDANEWIETLYRGNINCVEGKHFVKVYNGQQKIACHESEALFFNELTEKERLTAEGTHCHCIVRPVVMLLDRSTDCAISIAPLFEWGDAFDVFTTAKHVSCEKHVALYNNLGEALRHLHSLDFQHGDVKLENVMYSNDAHNCPRFCLTDCEFSGTPGMDTEHSSGTPNYASPERLSSPPKQDAKCDGWSFAMTIIAAWCKRLLQVTSFDAGSGHCRVHIEVCKVCNAALVLGGQGEQSVCVCKSLASYNQPMLNQTIECLMMHSFGKFQVELAGKLDERFINNGGAERSCAIVSSTLKGLLNIDPVNRLGPDAIVNLT